MTNIAAILNTQNEAEFAYASLLRNGFTKDDISLLISEESKKSFFKNSSPTNELLDQATEGAAAGIIFGALVGGLTAVGTIALPGIALLAAGPIATTLAGAEIGGLIGGLSGAINSELESEKDTYEKALKEGKAVLIVHTDSEDERNRARTILNDYTATRKAA